MCSESLRQVLCEGQFSTTARGIVSGEMIDEPFSRASEPDYDRIDVSTVCEFAYTFRVMLGRKDQRRKARIGSRR